jgi:hypothetical protein
MSSQRLHGGLITFCLLLSCRLSVAIDAGASPGLATPVANPAAIGSTDMTAPAAPAMMALPANTGSSVSDTSANRKFYTLTAELREVYDDNVGTSSTNAQASLETELSPSILVSFPMENSNFSARYTFDITYYSSNGSNNGGPGGNGSSVEYTHEFLAQFTHDFSERFSLALGEDFRYFTEPSIFQNTGTPYQDGAYVSNTFSGTVTAQWTPLIGTTTTYGNTIVRYDNAAVAADQNSMENTGSHFFSFSVLPKISLDFGGIADNITYDGGTRGYTSYTGFGGLQWQALPSLSMSGRGGATYTQTVQSQSVISPYAALSINWTIGARSSLSFSYAHEITPSDQAGANGQIADRFSSNFNYAITPSLSSHLDGTYTNSSVSQQLTVAGTNSSPNEGQYGLDTGFTYQYNSELGFDFGIDLSGVTSETDGNNYTRDEAYVGVRGTY